ncbi:MAG: hypothetical protein LBQ91_06645 [Oscillospiraceae bacterium]|jgi:hypothetical protein|nr:hypothetical protein [Oscillospiraceae bacterium]
MKVYQSFTPETPVYRNSAIAFLGALLGAIVGAIPGIVVGLYISLAPPYWILIGVGADLGFILFKGRYVGNRAAKPVTASILIVVVLGTFIFNVLLFMRNFQFSFTESAVYFFKAVRYGYPERAKILIILIFGGMVAFGGACIRVAIINRKNLPPPGALPPR